MYEEEKCHYRFQWYFQYIVQAAVVKSILVLILEAYTAKPFTIKKDSQIMKPNPKVK